MCKLLQTRVFREFFCVVFTWVRWNVLDVRRAPARPHESRSVWGGKLLVFLWNFDVGMGNKLFHFCVHEDENRSSTEYRTGNEWMIIYSFTCGALWACEPQQLRQRTSVSCLRPCDHWQFVRVCLLIQASVTDSCRMKGDRRNVSVFVCENQRVRVVSLFSLISLLFPRSLEMHLRKQRKIVCAIKIHVIMQLVLFLITSLTHKK